MDKLEETFLGKALLLMGTGEDTSLFKRFYHDVINELKVSGSSTKSILKAHCLIADIFIDYEKLQDAYEVFQTLMPIEKGIRGIDCKKILESHICYGSILCNLSKWDEAVEVYKTISEKIEANHGPKHEMTIDAQHDYAMILHKNEEFSTAIKEYTDVYKKAREVFESPPKPSKIADIEFNLACALQAIKEYYMAYRFFEKAHTRRKKFLGPDHLLTIQCQSRQACIMCDLKQHPKAIRLFQDIIKRATRKFGENHPETVREKTKLASAFHRSKRYKELVKLRNTITLPFKDGEEENSLFYIKRTGDFKGNNKSKTFQLMHEFIEDIDVFKRLRKKTESNDKFYSGLI